MNAWVQLVKEFTKSYGARVRKGRSVQGAVGWDDGEGGGLVGRSTDGQQGKKDREEFGLHFLTS